MALALANRIRETCSSPGTGAVTLLGAVTGYQTFAVVGNGNTTYYCIADQSGANWEVGIGTYSTTGPTLTRTTPLSGSSATPVNFATGTQDVFVMLPSEKAVYTDASGNVNIAGTIATTSLIPVAGTATVAPIKLTSGTNLTAAAAGAIEYDGTALYMTPFGTSRSYVPAYQIQMLTSTYTLTSQTPAQKLLNATTLIMS